jgi:hypothetical protein
MGKAPIIYGGGRKAQIQQKWRITVFAATLLSERICASSARFVKPL